MAAICDCGWNGTSTQVRDGGRCPECSALIRYESALVASTSLTVEEFNRRALIALKGVSFGFGSHAESIVAAAEQQVSLGRVSPRMQQALYNICNRFHRQITDRQVTDMAALRAKGYQS